MSDKLQSTPQASQVALVVRNPPASAGETRDAASIPGWEGPLEEGMAAHSRILAWRIPWATVHRVAKSQEVAELT